ncbi:MAG: (Fe-S)-binding protein [Nitrospiraceae bacterium]|nr:(Fe-S)-binding protein [Nitrospiraceae bacterium]
MPESESFTRCLSAGQLVELDACARCGECLKYCPVQEVTSDKSISPPEKIRLFREFIANTEGLKSKFFGPGKIDRRLLEDFAKAVYECTTCGACGQACTVGIFTQRLWPMLRREMVRRGLGPFGSQRETPAAVEKTGNPYGKPAGERFSSWLPAGLKIAGRAKLGYYAGCTGAYEAQPMVRGDVEVLGKIGEPFTMLDAEEEACCGFPLFITGQFELLEGLVKRLVDAYARRGVETLVCSCPCCVNMMSRDWPPFYGAKLPFRIRHITQYVAAALDGGRLRISGGTGETLIYHDPCYLSRGVGITEEPRSILRRIPGANLLEFDRHGAQSRCCGAGGAARKVFHDNAIAIARLSIDEARRKGAHRLVLSCPACYSKVGEAMAGYGENERHIRIVDIMELLSGVI